LLYREESQDVLTSNSLDFPEGSPLPCSMFAMLTGYAVGEEFFCANLAAPCRLTG
jgi:hypothetical protein